MRNTHFLPISHKVPVNPLAHLHVKLLIRSVHVPPLWQGLDEHSFTSVHKKTFIRVHSYMNSLKMGFFIVANNNECLIYAFYMTTYRFAWLCINLHQVNVVNSL